MPRVSLSTVCLFPSLLSLLALGSTAGTLPAGVINPPIIAPPLQPGGVVFLPSVSTAGPNNDNAGALNPNTIFVGQNFIALAPIDIRFTVAPSGGATEYAVVVSATNSVGVPLAGFLLELGFGGFGSGIDFVPSGLSDFLDFDAAERDPPPASLRFTTLDHQDDILVWSGGVLPPAPGGADSISFQIDVPDGLTAFHPQGLSEFTLRAFPTTPIPEPSTLVLTRVGALSLLGYGWRRWRVG